MSDYAKIWQRIWADHDFTALPAHTQQLYLLLISSPGRSNAGLLALTIRRWARFSADATVESIRSSLAELSGRNFIVVDWDTEELLIRTFIRNDEGYKIPNICKGILRAVEAVQSPTLRLVLSDELLRLPDKHGCHEIANSLITTSTQPPSEGNAYGNAKGYGNSNAEGCVEVVTYLGKGSNLQPQPQPTTATQPRGTTAQRQTCASDMLLRIIPAEHPRKVKIALRDQAMELLADGTPADLVEAALQLWLDRGISAPSILPSLVSDAIKLRAGPRNRPNTVDQKAMGWIAKGNE